MSFVQLVALEGKPIDGPLRLCSLPARKNVPILPTPTPMSEAHTSTPGSSRSQAEVAGSLEQQLATMERLADRQFPDDEAGRNAYLVGLLKTRLREYAAKFVQLEVREQA